MQKKRNIHRVLHELFHLLVHDEVKRLGISHWEKERLVDLTLNKLYPDICHLAESSKANPAIDDIFKKHFPDFTTLFQELHLIEEERKRPKI